MSHRHKWEVVSCQPVQVMGDGMCASVNSVVGYKTYIALRCRECGDIKSKTVKGFFDLRGIDDKV